MELNFLGIGSAFNPKLGNTSAFFIEEGDFYLIDCGESVYERIWDMDELINSRDIFILITHFHCDHVGSLGSLLSYLYLKLGKKAYVIHPTEKVIEYLDTVGIERKFYNYRERIPEGRNVSNKEYEVIHVDNMQCFGYKIMSDDKILYYSGDAINLPDDILKEFLDGEIDEIYQDTCNYISDKPTHGNIYELEKVIPMERRKNVYCMHLNLDYREEIERKNFGVIEIYKKGQE